MENMDKFIHCTKMGADKSAKNITNAPIGQKYHKCPKIYLPKLSVKFQKFWILMKKGFIGRL